MLIEFCKRITSELINLKIQTNTDKQELEALKEGVIKIEGIE